MDPADLDPDPIVQFRAWKLELSPLDDSVCLATVSGEGVPSARMVLVKGEVTEGFVFHTNRNSAKARDLAANARAALVFNWPPRSVRVTGDVELVSDLESDRYWATRPRGSQLGAWASDQSTVIADRSVLEDRLADAADRFRGGDVPRPPHWGGYRIIPAAIEFWEHREDRLHDRVRYRKEAGEWVRERLSP